LKEKESRAAKRYALGLVKTLGSESEYRLVKRELEAFLELLNRIDEFKAGMETFLFTKKQKKEILDSLHQELKFQEKTYRFLWTVLEESRMVCLDSIIRLLEELWFEKNGIEKLTVFSVVPLTPKLENKLKRNLEAAFKKKVALEKAIDRSLIAGIKIQRGHVFYDFSIQGNLRKLREALAADDSIIGVSAGGES